MIKCRLAREYENYARREKINAWLFKELRNQGKDKRKDVLLDMVEHPPLRLLESKGSREHFTSIVKIWLSFSLEHIDWMIEQQRRVGWH